jgi:hypothetical protein
MEFYINQNSDILNSFKKLRLKLLLIIFYCLEYLDFIENIIYYQVYILSSVHFNINYIR